MRRSRGTIALAVAAMAVSAPGASGQAPEVVDPTLAVTEAAGGLNQPIGVAFLDRDDMLVLEKDSGKIKRVVNGSVQGTVLDLPVNSASERGLLGIALHPKFRQNGWVYLFWSESLSGTDSTDLADVRLMANRIDRFEYRGGELEFDRHIISFRVFQDDATNGVLRGNHNGGVIRFGPDGKLYAIVGDTGRRGQTQNLLNGPFGPGIDDDQFGGPEPDDAHRTGVIVRLDDDGATPRDNPFWSAGRDMGGEVGANLQRIVAYGLRNSFGMTFVPESGQLWEQENGDDSFSELNRVPAGLNSGWVQIMGPASRVAQFRAIETDPTRPQPFTPNGYFGLQQARWSPENIAQTPAEALSRLVMFPGARFKDPELAWKYEVAPGGIDFISGRELGKEYRGDLFVGSARGSLRGGNLFRLPISGNRREVDPEDRRLKDKVADNVAKYEITESESLLFGENFGVTPDLKESPDGSLYVVSSSQGNVYKISRK